MAGLNCVPQSLMILRGPTSLHFIFGAVSLHQTYNSSSDLGQHAELCLLHETTNLIPDTAPIGYGCSQIPWSSKLFVPQQFHSKFLTA